MDTEAICDGNRECFRLERELAAQKAVTDAAEQQVQTLTRELEEICTLKTDILDSPDKWMRWCDHKILERAEAAEARLRELVEVLRDAEWGGSDFYEGEHCPVCLNYQRDGHHSDCRLSAALGAPPERT